MTVTESIPEDTSQATKTIWESVDTLFEDIASADIASILANDLWQTAQDLYEWALGVALNVLFNQILTELTNEIVAWIQGGEEPRFLSMDLEDWLGDAANNAGGLFVDQFLGAGWLCEPFDADIKIALLDVPTFETEAECTLEDMGKNISNFYENCFAYL